MRFTSWTGRHLVAALIGVGVLAAGLGGAKAHSAPSAYPFPRIEAPKLDSSLARIARVRSSSGPTAALAAAKAAGISTDGGAVRVVVAAQPGVSAVAVGRDVADAGGAVDGVAGSLTEALVPPQGLLSLSDRVTVANVRPPLPHSGDAVDEAVHLTNADAWHDAGESGAGVKVAIIDLGFYGYTSLLGSALPSSVTPIDHCGGNITASPANGGTQHGTAVSELVHQMAPGAQLYLICVDSEVGLAQAEQDVIAH